MTRYAGLLRGVNVVGVRMRMADLADTVRGIGYGGVATVLASGNVRFETDDTADAAKTRLEAALRERFGYEAWVHVRTRDELAAIVARFPFERAADRHAYVVFVVESGTREELLATPIDPTIERIEAGDGVVYWSVPKGSTLDSAFGRAQSAARHRQWLTVRNLNTLEKLTA